MLRFAKRIIGAIAGFIFTIIFLFIVLICMALSGEDGISNSKNTINIDGKGKIMINVHNENEDLAIDYDCDSKKHCSKTRYYINKITDIRTESEFSHDVSEVGKAYLSNKENYNELYNDSFKYKDQLKEFEEVEMNGQKGIFISGEKPFLTMKPNNVFDDDYDAHAMYILQIEGSDKVFVIATKDAETAKLIYKSFDISFESE